MCLTYRMSLRGGVLPWQCQGKCADEAISAKLGHFVCVPRLTLGTPLSAKTVTDFIEEVMGSLPGVLRLSRQRLRVLLLYLPRCQHHLR